MQNQANGGALSRRQFVKVAAAGAAMALGWGCGSAGMGGPEGRTPNFLVILADDMGFSDAQCYGGEIATPNLDRLASGGVRFTQCYSTGRCWPSRSCLMSGYYAQQIRMDPPKGKLPTWTRLLPHYLKPLDYRCYHSGKWHIMGAPHPVADGGFDRSYSIEDHDRFFSPKHALLDDVKLPPVEPGQGFYLTTAIADYAIDFLGQHEREHQAKPFCLYLAFTSPHFPLQALQEDIDRYRDRYLEGWDAVRRQRHERMTQMGIVNCALSPLDGQTIPGWNLSEDELRSKIGPGEEGYAVAWDQLSEEQKHFQATKMAIHAAMIDRMDREIGRVLKQIDAMGALGETVVFFASDNGASAEQIIRGDGNDPAAAPGSAGSYLCLGPGWSSAANTPFRLHKHWNHEGGIASPLIVHWPKGIATGGTLRHTPCHFIDLVPTLLDLADVQPGREWAGETAPPLPGRSLTPAFASDTAVPREFLYWHHSDHRAVRVGDRKLVAKGAKGPWELYDLKTDRCEMKDLSAAQPDQVRELTALWETQEALFRKQAGPPPTAQKAPKPGKQ